MPGGSYAAPGYQGAKSKEVERKRLAERGLFGCGRVPVGTKGPPCGPSLYQSPALPGLTYINPLVVSLGA